MLAMTTPLRHVFKSLAGLAYVPPPPPDARAVNRNVAYGQATMIPAGIRSRFVDNINGLRVHILEAEFQQSRRARCLCSSTGFPELAYSWEKSLLPLAGAGYHAIAPDLRGFGRTTGWASDYDTDLSPFSILNMVKDALDLVTAHFRLSVRGRGDWARLRARPLPAGARSHGLKRSARSS